MEHPGENTFRDYFQPRSCSDAGIKSDAVTHRLSQLFAQHVGHSLRNAFGSQAARFQQQDFFACKPGFFQQCQRQKRTFSCSWRGLNDQGRSIGKALFDCRDNFRNR